MPPICDSPNSPTDRDPGYLGARLFAGDGTKVKAIQSTIGVLVLPRWKRLRTLLIGNTKQGVLLNLAGLNRDSRDVKTWIFCDLNGVKLRRVALSADLPKRASHCSMGCIVSRYAQASSGAGAMHTDKVPSGMSDDRIEDRCRDLFNMRPAIAERFSERIQTIGEDATTAQEYRMQFHSRTLLGGASVGGLLEEVKLSLEETEAFDDECSLMGSSATSNGSVLIAPGSTGAITCASGWLNGGYT